ncbi:YcgL domain-containing protein [Luteibacter anthropi]|uniref:YcgL domain-containing protein HBF25_02915 n=1 Tax=Luteibacter anthropi TaxID=564369 RepID=A0A7X5U7Q0_9GAMM|nr:YcgL domain-containing protein [Luteibacter anthropi]NII05337.1 YcgL domain-containing protein [Luteibacter anthropi]URX64129.1 YcgL domain-containing protein [Luteibacter anthropi]
MHCFVYASLRKPDTYVWLSRRDGFDLLPETLALMLGDLRFALEVELTPQRKLPHEDTQRVLDSLRDQGWHLQTPPNETLVSCNRPNHNRELDIDPSVRN